MSNTDIRLLLSFRSHPKMKKLRLKLGEAGPLGFIFLLMHAAENKPDGILQGMDQDDIALAGDYRGDVVEFVDTLVALRLLDFDGETYSIHDFLEHQPWVSTAPARKKKAKKAADTRWGNAEPPTNNQALSPKKDAPSMNEHCSEHDLALPKSQSSNAPSPSPSPSPIPTPHSEKPTEVKSDGGAIDYSNWKPDEACLARIHATDRDVTNSFIEKERLDFITLAEDNRIPPRLMRARFQAQVHRHWIETKGRELNTGPLRKRSMKDIRDIPVDELEGWSLARGGPRPNAGEDADGYRIRIVQALNGKTEPANQMIAGMAESMRVN